MMEAMQSLKERKELFVRDLSGTTKLEVFCVTAALPLACFIASWIGYALGRLPFLRSNAKVLQLICFFVEFGALVLPQIALTTDLISPYITCAVLAGLWATITAVRLRGLVHRYHNNPTAILTELHLSIGSRRKAYISSLRAGTLVITCLAILAVDFPAFPRRYAKAERHGTGLMDVGVGLLLLASALVARPAVDNSFCHLDWYRRLGRGLSAAGPIWVLGFGRLVAVKLAGYQEHVGEYGVHWNFFFTMAVVLLVVHVLGVPADTLWLIGRGMLIAHQGALAYGADILPLEKSTAGWSLWVHGDERGEGLLEGNKEGIMSLPGYAGLYMLSCHLGNTMLTSSTSMLKELAERHNNKSKAPLYPLWRWLALLATRAIGSWVVCEALSYVESPSRRACNAAYVAWVYGMAMTMMLVLLLTQLCTAPEGKMPQLLLACNRNMLPLFLLSNVATGLVNMSVNTLDVADLPARGILVVYMLGVMGIASLLDALDITIKFW